jgi:hypothetical protein
LESDVLGAGIETLTLPPIKLDDVAKECAFIRDAIATGGATLGQPQWNLTTLLATFTEGGRFDAHRMGNQHPGYTPQSTDQLYDRKRRERDRSSIGWPRCNAISASGCTACQTCAHSGEGKSPLHFAKRTLAPLPHGEQTAVAPLAARFEAIAPENDVAAAIEIVTAVASNDNSPDPLRFTTLPAKEAVARINREFFVLRSSGKIYRDDTEGELHAVPKQDFKTALGGRWVTVNENGEAKSRGAADAWINDPERREYRGIQYCPTEIGLRPNYLNLWKGWGDLTPAQGDCSIVLDHILGNVADGDQAKCDFMFDWLADILQNPTRKPGVCIVLRGRAAARA